MGVAAAGVALVAVTVLSPAARRAARPMLKAGVKQLALASIAARRALAQAGEAWEDLTAEITAEMASEMAAAQTAATAAAKPEAPEAAPAPAMPDPPVKKKAAPRQRKSRAGMQDG